MTEVYNAEGLLCEARSGHRHRFVPSMVSMSATPLRTPGSVSRRTDQVDRRVILVDISVHAEDRDTSDATERPTRIVNEPTRPLGEIVPIFFQVDT